jgi:hypothetical protein
MPVHSRNLSDRRADDDRYQELKARLIAEWRGVAPPEPGAPDITEERDRRARVVHVQVIWDDWADLDAQTRSEMIVDAFQAVRGEEAIVDLSLAMGLTRTEAERFRTGKA